MFSALCTLKIPLLVMQDFCCCWCGSCHYGHWPSCCNSCSSEGCWSWTSRYRSFWDKWGNKDWYLVIQCLPLPIQKSWNSKFCFTILMQAFASQFVYCRKKLELDPERINVNGEQWLSVILWEQQVFMLPNLKSIWFLLFLFFFPKYTVGLDDLMSYYLEIGLVHQTPL